LQTPAAERLQLETTRFDKIIDLVWVARWEMKERVENIQRAKAQSDRCLLLFESDEALRGLFKSVTAVGVGICQQENLTPQSCISNEAKDSLDLSIKTRRAYTIFQRNVLHLRDETDVYKNLRKVSKAIAILRGKNVFDQLRFFDRALLKSLQSKTIEWLGKADRDPLTGAMLWQDAVGFAELLGEINKRSELVEHDLSVLQNCYTILTSLVVSLIPEEIVSQLQTVFGRHPELDQLLESKENRSVKEWQRAIELAMAQISTPETDALTALSTAA
ncbi:MAG: hypothetical protein JNN15_16070, partial [Blastocatellia bacterium]|nr:hypothetical protein [Blastocatellia bacterium]